MRLAGYTKTDAFSPFPLHEIDEALGIKRRFLRAGIRRRYCRALVGDRAAGIRADIDYQLNVGGRPYLSWPSLCSAGFRADILFSRVHAVRMMFLNGLPSPYHPVFNVPRFALATREKFFLIIEAKDPKFVYDDTRKFMESLGPQEVFDVPE